MGKQKSPPKFPFPIEWLNHWHEATNCTCEKCKAVNEYYGITNDDVGIWVKYGSNQAQETYGKSGVVQEKQKRIDE